MGVTGFGHIDQYRIIRAGEECGHNRSMTTPIPPRLNAWQMVATRRIVAGCLPLSALTRLSGALFDSQGEVSFCLSFDHDALAGAYVELEVDTRLPLQCQRRLHRFELPVQLRQRLGLIRDQAEEARLLPGYEPLLVPESGELFTADLVEDELILALPVVPIDPAERAEHQEGPLAPPPPEPAQPNPFAVLAALKQKS